jgi:hypothetical protein
VALLPDARPATLARFRKHAFAFVTGARVSWQVDRQRAEVRTSFTLQTAQRDTGPTLETTPLVALYPHQWKHLGRDLSGASYPSPRGPMKLLAADRFETRLPFGGVLPILPRPTDGNGFDADDLASQVRAAARAPDLFPKASMARGGPTGRASRCSGWRCWPGWPSRRARPRCGSSWSRP